MPDFDDHVKLLDGPLSRRRVITGGASGIATLLAGCNNRSSSEVTTSTTTSTTTTSTPTTTDTTTENTTATTTETPAEDTPGDTTTTGGEPVDFTFDEIYFRDKNDYYSRDAVEPFIEKAKEEYDHWLKVTLDAARRFNNDNDVDGTDFNEHFVGNARHIAREYFGRNTEDLILFNVTIFIDGRIYYRTEQFMIYKDEQENWTPRVMRVSESTIDTLTPPGKAPDQAFDPGWAREMASLEIEGIKRTMKEGADYEGFPEGDPSHDDLEKALLGVIYMFGGDEFSSPFWEKGLEGDFSPENIESLNLLHENPDGDVVHGFERMVERGYEAAYNAEEGSYIVFEGPVSDPEVTISSEEKHPDSLC